MIPGHPRRRCSQAPPPPADSLPLLDRGARPPWCAKLSEEETTEKMGLTGALFSGCTGEQGTDVEGIEFTERERSAGL